ncbi:protein SPT2 homolog [Venturia canescens]|uniref:protein SPT2 homolog n=1 Tax=Venturia canescens TaxID=32260 RepID=UPI001C9BF923|nr:protein SPT2 homolog [Venturia canescens]
MDFGTLLSVAQKNSANKQASSYYPTKFTPPKKECKQSRNLSNNIKKFLAKKEEEERQKALEEKKKRENLLSLRDHKAQSRINKHLKVCKAANKSVLADAVNNDDTAVTMAGPSQPDEDDYGYVSQEASAFYNQLMNKYSNLPPEKPLFSETGKKTVKDIASTKDRVRQALKQQELEESLPHRRKRKSTSTSSKETEQETTKAERDRMTEREKEPEREEKPKPKKKPPGPPPLDFVSLLKLAEKKQHEPVVIEAKPKPKVEDRERLMTKKQMKEYMKEREWREKRDREKNGEATKPATGSSTETSKSSKSEVSKPSPNKIPKLSNNGKSAPPSILEKTLTKPTNSTYTRPIERKAPERPTEKSFTSKISVKDELLEERKKLEAEKKQLESMRRMIEEEKRKLALSKMSSKRADDGKSSALNSTKSKFDSRPDRGPPVDSKDIKPRQFPPTDVKPKQFPPPDVKSRQGPMSNGKARPFPPQDVRGRNPKLGAKRPVNRRRIYDDDEDEYDSELDDFIDDGPEEESEDYSKYISEIFGYDKSKYRNMDDDDGNMESTFAQQLKEEFVSTKIGIMEDLEDMRMEAMENKRKALMKKKAKK